ncbi:Uracil-regulated protein 1 [Tilletia horrida]|uniref:Uracil-regulated protein 1 n=1 Tax=Tilletia horrida TaxID=155126 RepID=A0AAN6GWF8_9BASI|nr:Uracil-regulated protein 1 [Tilletia horrida]KAK0556983.1 Uracil-regulated protein 1 [Tilletia horrida]
MATTSSSSEAATAAVLEKILAELSELKTRNQVLESKLDHIQGASIISSPIINAQAGFAPGRRESSGLQPIPSHSLSFSPTDTPLLNTASLGLPSLPEGGVRGSSTAGATSAAGHPLNDGNPAAPHLPPTASSTPFNKSPELVGQAGGAVPVAIPLGGSNRSGFTLVTDPQSGSAQQLSTSAGSVSSVTAGSGNVPSTSTLGGKYSSRIILASHPGQTGIRPLPLRWGGGSQDPRERGPVVASRHPNSIRIRNAVGAYGGSYSIYRALSIAMGQLDPNHRPDYTNTEPPFEVSPNPSWFDPTKIVSLDPFGHLAPQLFKKELDEGVDVRPTIAMTKAHIKMPEIDAAIKAGNLPIDGKIVVRSERLPGMSADEDPGCEITVSKAAVEPVWYLPGVAQRLGVTEAGLRRALFEETGGSCPELLTRHDINVFLPPISGLTAYIFGNPKFVSDESKEVTVRVHDECNGSDVFGSDICTCRPYLLFGLIEAIKTAQRGGSGVVIYFRKEGRALGEVIKYLVYNARKRGTDSASMYFKRTENIAGVKDMRFQALMPDILHWLGIKRIDNMISMSDMKHDAIVNSGIPIVKRYEIPEELIPSAYSFAFA